ncbi:MAG: hypothetical protein ACRDA3_12870 [Peptostreptococcaceae bacterium]
MEDNVFEIPIKIEKYEDFFNEFDYRDIKNRELNEDIDDLIDKIILTSNRKIKNQKLELIIYIPKDKENHKVEKDVEEGIINYYKSYFNYKKKINIMGMKRIVYYIVYALILLSLWNFIYKYKGENFIGALLNAGGTVLLWEIMSMILIERKNLKDRIIIKRKMLNMNIIFKYI